MIIRRIQAIEPAEEHTEGGKNNARVEDSTHCDTDTQSAQIKIVRHVMDRLKDISRQVAFACEFLKLRKVLSELMNLTADVA